MSIIVGQAVINSDFWDRTDELEDIWNAVESGSHILISAPRRVGKTSIMYKVLDEQKQIIILLPLAQLFQKNRIVLECLLCWLKIE